MIGGLLSEVKQPKAYTLWVMYQLGARKNSQYWLVQLTLKLQTFFFWKHRVGVREQNANQFSSRVISFRATIQLLRGEFRNAIASVSPKIFACLWLPGTHYFLPRDALKHRGNVNKNAFCWYSPKSQSFAPQIVVHMHMGCVNKITCSSWGLDACSAPKMHFCLFSDKIPM